MKMQLRMAFRFVTLLAAVLVSFLAAAPAHADDLGVAMFPLDNVAAGSTGNSFDVFLSNDSFPPVSIAGFSFEVTSSSSDITFTDATTATGYVYIFGADSLFGPDIIGAGSTATDINASDLDSAGSVSFEGGMAAGLGRVFFDVSPTAPTQTVTFELVGFPGTSLADASGNNVPITTLVSGQFQINGVSPPVPEPSALILLLASVPLALARRRTIR